MKNVILIGIFCVFTLVSIQSCSGGRIVSKSQIYNYKTALKYIEKNYKLAELLYVPEKKFEKNKGFYVSPNIFYPDLFTIYLDLNNSNMEYLEIAGRKINLNENLADTLLMLDKKLSFEPFKCEELEVLSTNKDSKCIVFFSMVQDNIFSASITWDEDFERNMLALSYNYPSLDIWFLFDNDGKITHVFDTVMWP